MHLENILTITDEFETAISKARTIEERLSLNDKIKKLEQLETILNRNIIEFNKDTIISKVTRLLFTSTFKTSQFNDMIDKLDGFQFSEKTEKLIKRLRVTLDRERNTLDTKAGSIENKFLALLNYLAIFELGLVLIDLWLGDILSTELLGTIQIILAFVVVILIFYIYRNRQKNL